MRTVRVDRQVDHLVTRARPGEIAVIDVVDLDRGTAEQLVSAGVSAVVNASASFSGRFPVRGPQTLLEAGVLLVNDVGGEVFARVRDGDTIRLDGASVYAAGERVVEGLLQSDESVAEANRCAHAGLEARVAGLVADAGRRLADDDGRLLEGDGFPPLSTRWRNGVVAVVTAAATPAELRAVRRLARRRGAVVLAVGSGADLYRASGLRADLVVIGRSGGTPSSFAGCGEVLLLDGADPEDPVPAGVPRAHAASLGSPEDTAVLLAHTRGAALVVTCGLDDSLGGVLDRSVAAGSIPLLGRLRGGGRQVGVDALGALRSGRSPRGGRTLGVLAALVALAVGLALGAGPLRSELDRNGPGHAADAAQVAAADRRAAAASGLAAALAPAVVDGRLAGHAVTVVALPGATGTAALVSTLQQAGASVRGPVRLTTTYLAAGQARVLRELATQVAPTLGAGATATSGGNPQTGLDAVLAGALATRTTSAVTTPVPQVGTLLDALSRIGALSVASTQLPRSDLVVLSVPARATPAVAARGASLAAAFARAGRSVAVVSTGGTPGAPAGGVVGAVRAGGPVPRLSSIDDVDQLAGRVATVLALDDVLGGGAGGSYGRSSDAASVVPVLAGPAGAPGTSPPG